MNQNVVAASVEDDAVEVDAQYHPLLDNNFISWTTRRYIDISPKKHQGGKKVVLKVGSPTRLTVCAQTRPSCLRTTVPLPRS
jgi:hypothetical protein